jgi:hypothetical protein
MSLCGGTMSVGRRWKEMTAADEAPMTCCSGYEEDKMNMWLSGGENDQSWDDIFIVVEGES